MKTRWILLAMVLLGGCSASNEATNSSSPNAKTPVPEYVGYFANTPDLKTKNAKLFRIHPEGRVDLVYSGNPRDWLSFERIWTAGWEERVARDDLRLIAILDPATRTPYQTSSGVLGHTYQIDWSYREGGVLGYDGQEVRQRHGHVTDRKTVVIFFPEDRTAPLELIDLEDIGDLDAAHLGSISLFSESNTRRVEETIALKQIEATRQSMGHALTWLRTIGAQPERTEWVLESRRFLDSQGKALDQAPESFATNEALFELSRETRSFLNCSPFYDDEDFLSLYRSVSSEERKQGVENLPFKVTLDLQGRFSFLSLQSPQTEEEIFAEEIQMSFRVENEEKFLEVQFTDTDMNSLVLRYQKTLYDRDGNVLESR